MKIAALGPVGGSVSLRFAAFDGLPHSASLRSMVRSMVSNGRETHQSPMEGEEKTDGERGEETQGGAQNNFGGKKLIGGKKLVGGKSQN